jgi:O-antigen ligase
MSVLPFITYYYEFNTGLSNYSWRPSTDLGLDVFLYYKQVFFIVSILISILIMIYQLIFKKISFKFTLPLLFLLVYSLLSLLSTVFSKYSHWGYTGFLEQFETVFVLIGYCIIVYYIYQSVNSEQDLSFIIKYFIISILVLSLLGISQIIGHDFLATTLGKKLYMPTNLWGSLDSMQFNFEKNRVFLTLFNPNYVGVYVSMVLPFLIGLLLTERVIKNIILLSLSIIGMIICLIGSLSSTGILTTFITLLILMFMFRKYIFKSHKQTLLALGIALIICIPFVLIKSDTVSDTLDKLFNIKSSDYAISEIRTDETLSITYYDNTINIDIDVNDSNLISLSDENGTSLSYNYNPEINSYTISDSRFENISIMPVNYNSILCIQITVDNRNWLFSNQTGDNTFYYINEYGKFDKIISADSSIFTGYESYLSNRGYIWSRAIPLLKNHILLGSGADSFAMVFPQQDYIGLYNAGFEGQLLTKPHNMYLQMGIQTGVLSLICFLLFYGIYFIKSFRIYIHGRFNTYYSKLGVSIFLGTIGYMIAGITNDSSITVSPVFWVLMGLGYVSNRLVESNMDK